jgi:glycosyltransferase involved in cell wall biosynthesis
MERGVEIVLFAEAEEPVAKDAIDYMKQYCNEIKVIPIKKRNNKMALFLSIFSSLPFTIGSRTSLEVRNTIAGYIQENPVDIFICDAIHRALNIPFDCKGYKVLYEHNVESVILKRYMEVGKNILKQLFAFVEYIKLERFQKKMWRRFDCSIVCSTLDKKIMEEKAGNIKVFVVDNGVDSDFFTADANSRIDRNAIVYTGQIGWYPNEDAVLYFAKEVFPLVKKELPLATLWIVGNAPSQKIRSLSEKDPSIIVTGFVDDVRPYIAKAGAYIVPLRIGAGTRLKILEALSMKKAVVTTSIGCEGLEVEDGKHLLIRDTKEGFANAVTTVLKDEKRYLHLGENGFCLIQKKYEWKNVFKELDMMLAEIGVHYPTHELQEQLK